MEVFLNKIDKSSIPTSVCCNGGGRSSFQFLTEFCTDTKPNAAMNNITTWLILGMIKLEHCLTRNIITNP